MFGFESRTFRPTGTGFFGVCFATFFLLSGVLPARAQLIPIKSVPVASGDQFLLFPSENLAMGGVGLGLADHLGDPFSNPATGSRVSETLFFGSPTFYGISDRNGSGKSLPLGALFTSGSWFGGGAVSLQELKGADRERTWPFFATREPWDSRMWPLPEPSQDLSELSARNLYAYGMLGYRFPEKGLSVGISGTYADLGAVDGVDLLYALSQEIDQSGHMSDVRLGLLKEWESGQSMEVVLTRNKVRMQHDVTYLNLVWEPLPPDTFPVPQWRTRVDENLDHTDTWGAHVAFRRPIGTNGWQVGWSFTANRKDHPKIPNYEIQNIPRDPGETQAYALGAGIAKAEGPARFAVDMFLEPIRSDTWANAAADTTDVFGNIIKAGEKTIENEFVFTNALIKAGVAWDYKIATFKGGLNVRSISYELEQVNNIEPFNLMSWKRKQDESWMEWTPSFGVSLALQGVTLHYAARITTGTGRPGTRWSNARMAESGLDSGLGSDFILAPQGPLTLQDARVTTHQLSVVIPMR
ncbi:MAG: hypothetical protein HKO65_20220 [Gemmatimonadetes bacterium]|nr:hypothetical protein [Gemmatimonadota bacterium]NNM07429.1 hypothetical protein [Gemmatimonadota bacterium]